jgi:hypothetical protein
MSERSEMNRRHALRIWQFRQKTDGHLALLMVFVTAIPVLHFFFTPSPATAGVMFCFLLALGAACLRLLNSASMVVRIRNSLQPQIAPEIIEAETVNSLSRRN